MTAHPFAEPDVDAAQRFVERLRALPPEQWEAFARSLDPMRGDDIRSVWRRARRKALAASPGPAFLLELGQLAFTIEELLDELRKPRDPAAAVERARARLPELPPRVRPVVASIADLAEVAHQSLPGDRLAADVVAGAGHALMHRPVLRPAHFREVYAPLEPFVPAASVSDVA